MKKRTPAILLALLLTLANTPLAVYAASDGTIPQTVPQEETTAPTTEPVSEPTEETTTPSTEPVPESTDESTAPTTEPTAPPSSEETTAPTAEPTTAPTEETTAPTEETLPEDSITQAELEDAFAISDFYHLTANLVLESDFILPHGKELDVSASLTIPAGCTLTVDGRLSVSPHNWTDNTGKLIAEDGSNVIISESGSIHAIAHTNADELDCIFGIDRKLVHASYELLENAIPSDDALQAWVNSASAEYKDVYLSFPEPHTLSQSFSIPKNVLVETCDFTVSKDCTLIIYGKLNVKSDFLTINGTVDNQGTLALFTSDQLRNNGSLLGNPITILDIPQSGQDKLEAELEIQNNTGTTDTVVLVRNFHIPANGNVVVAAGGSIIVPNGITVTVDGCLSASNWAHILVEEGGHLEINGRTVITCNGTLTNNGTISLSAEGSILKIDRDGKLLGNGEIHKIGGVILDQTTFGKDAEDDLDKLTNYTDLLSPWEIRDAVQSIGADKLAQAMQSPNNNAAVEDLTTLENAAGGPAQVIVDDSASLEFDPNLVTIIGANLNQSSLISPPRPVQLVLGPPQKADNPIPDSYDKQLAIHFSMNLNHVDDPENLPVPVYISIPIPKKLTAENLAIFHYHQDGSHEIIHLTKDNIYSEDGQRYATIVLTSFSDFALAPLLDTTEPTEKPITQAELEEILATTDYYQLKTDLVLESDFVLPQGKQLEVSSLLTIPADCTLTVAGRLSVTPYNRDNRGKLVAEDGSNVVITATGGIHAIARTGTGELDCIFGIDRKLVHAMYELFEDVTPSDDVIQAWIDRTSAEYMDVYLSFLGHHTLTQSLTIPENVLVETCDFTVSNDCTLTIYGELNIAFDFLTINGTVNNQGTLTLYTSEQLRNNGTLLGNPVTFLDIPLSGQEKIEAELADRHNSYTGDFVTLVRDLHIPSDCYLGVTVGGSIIIPKGITMTVDGDLSAYNWSNIVVEAGGHLEINGSATISYNSTLTNNGTISLRAKGSILKIRSDGKLLGDGKIHEIGGVNLDQTAFGENPKKDLDKLNNCKDHLSPGEILGAVQSIGSDKLAQAMQSPKNNAAVEDLAALEQAAGGHAQVIVNDPGSLEIDATQVTVIGARLNQTRFDPEPKLIIGPPDGVDNPIPSGCDHTLAIHFSMHLENVGDPENLLVPVCISIPIPKKLPAENLAIVHYHQDGSHEIIYLTKDNIYSEKGQWYASIVLTSFSDFALVPLLEAPAPELDLDAMAEPIQGLTTNNVTSAHREAIDTVLNDVDTALKLDNLTQEQIKALNELKEEANALLAAVNKAHAKVNTEQIQSALNITPETLELRDEQALDHAYDVLSKAAASSNFTVDEQKALEQKADSIQEKRAMITNAKKTIVLLDDLPEKVSADNLKHREAVSSALDAFAELHPQEQRLVGKDLANKLGRLKNALEYRITQGNNSIWKRSSTKGLTITANGPVELFKGIEIDGTAVSQRHYAVSSGSTVITLKPHFLDDLKLGRHSITFVYENDFAGTEDLTASGTFRISSIFSFNPQTGDTIYITISVLVLSTLALAIMFLWIYGKKRRK